MTREKKEAIFSYFTQLRNSGTLTMFLAPQVIAKLFEISSDTAEQLFLEWAETQRDIS
jgi:hypothetical protein